MAKIVKRLLILLACALFALGCAYCVLSNETTKAENEVKVSIDYCNLAFEDEVYILYAVKTEGTEETPTLKLWEEIDERTDSNITATLTPYDKGEIDHEEYYMFAYKNLVAKQMTDNVYVKACVGGVESEEVKYSILQYAKNKIGNCDEALENVLTSMLEYGANMQIYRNYKTDRLATATFYSLTVVGGTLSDGTTNGLFTENETVFVTPDEIEGKEFVCWKDQDDETVDTASGIKIEKDTTLTATFKDKVTAKLYTRIDGSGTESATGEYILFGSYPQTDVTSDMGDDLSSYVTNKPSNGNNNGWTSYKYYIGTGSSGSESNSTDYMWYKDVDVDSNGTLDYRAVYFTSYRPHDTDYSSSASNSNQDYNGYSTSNVYWFKYEPIKWRILTESSGKATLLAELIIDSQDYNYTSSSRTIGGKTVYANNYEYSTIRAWLNDNFFKTAFNGDEQNAINPITVDNSARSTNPANNGAKWNSGNNSYACNNTLDKVWLLSEQEVTNADYNFNTEPSNDDTVRRKKTSEYARCMGAYTSSSYLVNGNWWLRSPRCNYDYSAWCVDINGYSNIRSSVTGTDRGVVPAIEITLDGGTGAEHTHTYSESWTYDSTYHWHAATCEHTSEVSGKVAHTLVNGVCSVCGYQAKSTLTYGALDGGSIQTVKYSGGDTISNNTKVIHGSSITVVATTNSGYNFKGWYINGVFKSNSLSYTFTMPNYDIEVKAYFELQVVRVTNFTITLTWGSSPSDLDSHLSYFTDVNTTRNKHIYYSNMQSSSSNEFLDVDDTSSYGPEVITVKSVGNGVYAYSVHDYSNRSSSSSYSLSNSGAKVVFKFGENIREFTIPTNVKGTVWNVFIYDGNNGVLTVINEVVNVVTESSNVGSGLPSDYQRQTSTHTHTYSESWTYDSTYHWHAATCEHTSEVSGKVTHTFVNNVCSVCGYSNAPAPTAKLYTRIDGSGNESATGEYILFGSYPQTDVTSSMGTTLSSYVTNKPSNGNNNGWTSYKYYMGTGSSGTESNSTDYMWYKDVDVDSNGTFDYRAVYFTSYRPYYTYYSSSTSNTYQDDNGYSKSNVYWFKYEPIKWRILTESSGKATLLAELIIDSQDYNYTYQSRTIGGKTVYGNNYEYSSIRAWLNENFYNTAFSELEQAIINTVTVDNSARSTNPNNNATYWNSGNNSYACNNTLDKVWLLSQQEVTNADYKFNTDPSNYDTVRRKKTSAYAQCMGAYTSTSSGYVGNGFWWLRSPCCNDDSYAWRVNYTGNSYDFDLVNSTSYGVVPALQISL